MRSLQKSFYIAEKTRENLEMIYWGFTLNQKMGFGPCCGQWLVPAVFFH